MATNYKVLGQSAPAATTATALYTVPSATEAIISTIVVANRAAAARSYRIAIRPNGDSLANQHYLAYDVAIAANDSTALTLGITVDAADVVEVYASAADLSFTAFGSELT
jgi:glucose-6-phosphate dehydrogenase assembly protein OpcA